MIIEVSAQKSIGSDPLRVGGSTSGTPSGTVPPERSAAPLDNMAFDTPHRAKLDELEHNDKLPEGDRLRLKELVRPKYDGWIKAMESATATGDDLVKELVRALNEYKRILELDFVWDSESDFLYRQRGQLKLDSSVIEEFLPRLTDSKIVPSLKGIEFASGPRTAFASTYFATTLLAPGKGAGILVRTKDQDFTIGRSAFLRASTTSAFTPETTVTHEVFLAFVAAECKTNLDKTMFQEAAATAHDLKRAIVGSRYYLLCEWLDMAPISTATTDIDQVIILRGKRLNSNVRKDFSNAKARKESRAKYVEILEANPVRLERVTHFVSLLREAFDRKEVSEDEILKRGYF